MKKVAVPVAVWEIGERIGSRVDLQNQPATSTDCKILLHSGSLALCTEFTGIMIAN